MEGSIGNRTPLELCLSEYVSYQGGDRGQNNDRTEIVDKTAIELGQSVEAQSGEERLRSRPFTDGRAFGGINRDPCG